MQNGLYGMNKNFNNYYEDKTVFVTGHNGFKGSWLSWWLIKLGARVIGYSLSPDSSKSIYNVTNLSSKLIDLTGDIRDYLNLSETIQKYQPDVIFHLAAQPLVIDSYKDPSYTYETNVMGTLNLLRSIDTIQKEAQIIIVTTDKVYRNDELSIAFIETDPLGGYDPYSSSKACVDLLVDSWRYSYYPLKEYASHKKALATVRAGNVIGGGDLSKNRLIPDILRSVKNKEKLLIRNEDAVRPWQHVLEPLFGYLLLPVMMRDNHLIYSTSWNFGSKKDHFYSVKEIVGKFKNHFPQLDFDPSKTEFNESKHLTLDSSKAEEFLNWRPTLDIDSTIHLIVEWENSMDENKNMKEIVFNQIEYFLSRIEA
jgi:CDP-glucose 4,6-dehydratase